MLICLKEATGAHVNSLYEEARKFWNILSQGRYPQVVKKNERILLQESCENFLLMILAAIRLLGRYTQSNKLRDVAIFKECIFEEILIALESEGISSQPRIIRFISQHQKNHRSNSC